MAQLVEEAKEFFDEFVLGHSPDTPEYGYLDLFVNPRKDNEIGVWINKDDCLGGLNIISLPAAGTEPSQPAEPGTFVPVVFKYKEKLKFTKKGGARNRGGLSDQLNAAIVYKQEVFGSEKENNDLVLQHVENGMFLFLGKIRREPSDGSGDLFKPPFNYVRSGTVPHGNSLTILGMEVDPIDGPPDFDKKEIQALLNPVSESMGDPNGPYAEALTKQLEALGTNPTETLKDGIKGQNIIKTRTLVLSSKNKGNVVNTPFITKFANCVSMDVIFWIETVKNNDGTTFEQLQYSQTMILEFQMHDGSKIQWPHITVNTMIFKPAGPVAN